MASSYLRHGHSSGPTTRPRQHSGLLYTMHLHGHGCNHIPSRVPARLSPTRSTGGHPLYTDRPPSTGTASVTGPSSAQADSDPKTSLSRLIGADLELVKDADSDQITPTYLLDANGYKVRVGPSGFPKDRRTGASSASLTMLYLDTTTSASSPMEGTTTSASSPVEGTTTSASSPVEGTWCESHIMAPAVCILNPSNGTHNCRPGWRTCLGSTHSGSVLLYTCACLKSCRAAPKKAQVLC